MTQVQISESQREAIVHGEGPLLVVAGAGTGKTLVITHRIAHLINNKMAKPEEILALTFTEKAASEMSERVDLLLPYGLASIHISTFHAFGDHILREHGLELGLNPDFQVLSQPEQVIFFREQLFDFPLKQYRPLSDPTRFIQAMLKVISRAKDEDISPENYQTYYQSLEREYEKHQEDPLFLEKIKKQKEVADTYAQYQKLLAQESKVDFGDQVSLCLKLFRSRSTVLEQVKKRYRFILVDEFQDTNYAQFQLLQLLGGEKANITVVGDDDQSIYKFRGAAISNILNFKEFYPQAEQVVLTENFRSTQVILDSAYRLILHNNPDRLEVKNHIDKKLVSQRKEGKLVEHLHCDTITTESDRVAQIISDLVENKKIQYGQIAILVRSNNNADSFIRALNMKEIPWRFSGNRGLYSRPEVKHLMAFLKIVANPEDSIILYALAASELYEIKSMEEIHRCVNLAYQKNRSLFSIFKELDQFDELKDLSSDTRSSIQKMVQDIQNYIEKSRDQITGNVLYQFLMSSNYLKRLTERETPENNIKIQNIAHFFDVIWAFAQVAREDRVIHFVRYLDLLIEAGDNPGTAEADFDVDAVHIMTIHKAKGLEWPVVFMVNLVHNKFPHIHRKEPIELPEELVQEILPKGDFHLQEERRLFYVGMTRAEDQLYLTSALDYGGIRKRKVSQFVLEALDRPQIGEVNVKARAEERIHRFAPSSCGIEPTMAPIPEDAILNLSHYQIDDYQTCPLKYKYIHVLRLPFFHHTIVYGKAVHAAVELYYKHKINQIPVQLEDLNAAYKMAWRNIGFLSQEHEERRFEGGLQAIKNFYNREEKEDLVPKMVEEPFSFLLGMNRVTGRWDRIDERHGFVVIVDFKTSEVYQQEAADKRAETSLQLAIYAMAYQKISNRLPDRLELHFLESGLIGQAVMTEKIAKKTEEIILSSALGIRKRDYTATPIYQACRFCAYSEVCPSAIRR